MSGAGRLIYTGKVRTTVSMMRGMRWCGGVWIVVVLGALALGQEGPGGDQPFPRPQSYQNMTPEQRAAATREFLGLGAKPDRVAAARGAPVFKQNCAFCHGPQARGATGPSLITSEEVLDDDHGERLVPYVKKGRPEKGMPSFASMEDAQLKDIAEFLHVQVEDVANRGAYHVLNILVGDKEKGKAYVEAHCAGCHEGSFAHIGSRYRSAEQLQRGWMWPSRGEDPKRAVMATVKTRNGLTVSGRVTQISDFRIVLVDAAGQSHGIEREPGVVVDVKDPLAAHERLIQGLTNEDMHNVTAWLASLK
jgi:cytochrome c oxidase cbb3-type subunit 3